MLLEMLIQEAAVDSFPHQKCICGMLLRLAAPLAWPGRADWDGHYEGGTQLF